ncbi:hypothetical protein GOP47_0025583 [Adiantum capillus-veneris]|uniref:YTH domain-containing protein n=1 Tax=Adiantum capillus-veneris TaxID=13818 RepID=A0A9D4U2D1_ADICA|nr:hypothetical protein GOP47_0025583 [Adiantum capillus-veneris]
MISDEMSSKALQQTGESESLNQGEGFPATLQSLDRSLPSRSVEKHTAMQRKNTEKSVLDDIMGDPDDFGDMGASDVESDGGRWEDTLREMEQCDAGVEENLQRKIIHSQAASDLSPDPEGLEVVLDQGLQHVPMVEQDSSKAEVIYTRLKEAGYAPTVTSNAASHHMAHLKRFFIIKSLNYHNIEKSIQKGIWATQAMNERILNEAFETADKVVLIFSVNMSGHFQGYAQMISPIGRRKVNVWSEANWGGTFSVEWIRLHDLPFQKTLHLKNPLNSHKPVKISRDCQELTAEIGEALCALIDEGANSEEYSKRRIHVRSDYFTKKPYVERPPFENSGYFTTPLRSQMQSVVYPANLLHQVPVRSPSMKYAGSSSSRPMMHFPGGFDVHHQEDKEALGIDTSREEDFLNMSYEEYLQFRKNSREPKLQQQVSAGSQMEAQFGAGWSGKGDADMRPDDAYATYLASWYANQQASVMHNGYYQTSPAVANSFRNSGQPP